MTEPTPLRRLAPIRDFVAALATRVRPTAQAEPEPVRCAACQDAGWLIPEDVLPSHPRFGQAVPCPACGLVAQRQRQRQIANLTERCGLSPRQQSWGFEQFQPGAHLDLQVALAAARHYANEPKGWLLFAGPPGTGKTMLLSCIANALLADAREVIYALVPDLLDAVRQRIREPRAGVDLDTLRSVEVLLLDDLGAGQLTPWVVGELEQLLDYRYRHELPTGVTTNVAPDQMGPALFRIASRLGDRRLATTLRLTAPDYRRTTERSD